MLSLAERIAKSAFTQFDGLPERSKPRIYADGTREWVPMSAVVLVQDVDSEHEILTCVALATGTKCLPASVLPDCHGTVLHDSHAEILALRGLNRFLLSEIKHMLQDLKYSSAFVSKAAPATPKLSSRSEVTFPFRLDSRVTVHLFTTSPPCGDASMDLLISSRPDDNTPWKSAPSLSPIVSIPSSFSTSPTQAIGLLHGHGHFSHLGVVRLKPSRPDAPPTVSKSCTDKLALKQFLGILSFPVDLLIQPVPLSSVVVPKSAWDEIGWKRAFGPNGRLKSAVKSNRDASFFDVLMLPATFPEFKYGRISGSVSAATGDTTATAHEDLLPNGGATGVSSLTKDKPGNVSALFILRAGDTGAAINETLIRGVKQGFRQLAEHPLKGSAVCRWKMWKSANEVVGLMAEQGMMSRAEKQEKILDATKTYREIKGCEERRARVEMKERVTRAMGGWLKNEGDEEWTLERGRV